ncbi:MAG: acyl-CoA thioesterase [Clostridia bacterium]|nr:acyl-CoA thioesterase [Clostridia bacterium]
MEKVKTAEASKTQQVHIVFTEDINGIGRLFGGRLVEWMDILAAVVARRHSECEVTTVSIDKVDFAAPAMLNDTVLLEGMLESVGNTSMRVNITAYVEKLNGERIMINSAKFVMVAMDEKGVPTRVPRLY